MSFPAQLTKSPSRMVSSEEVAGEATKKFIQFAKLCERSYAEVNDKPQESISEHGFIFEHISTHLEGFVWIWRCTGKSPVENDIHNQITHVVVFRGTVTIADWLSKNYQLVRASADKSHSFLDNIKRLLGYVLKFLHRPKSAKCCVDGQYRVLFTGHSLGASMAESMVAYISALQSGINSLMSAKANTDTVLSDDGKTSDIETKSVASLEPDTDVEDTPTSPQWATRSGSSSISSYSSPQMKHEHGKRFGPGTPKETNQFEGQSLINESVKMPSPPSKSPSSGKPMTPKGSLFNLTGALKNANADSKKLETQKIDESLTSDCKKYKSILGTFKFVVVGAVTFDSPGLPNHFMKEMSVKKGKNKDLADDLLILDSVWTLNSIPNLINTLNTPVAETFYCCSVGSQFTFALVGHILNQILFEEGLFSFFSKNTREHSMDSIIQHLNKSNIKEGDRDLWPVFSGTALRMMTALMSVGRCFVGYWIVRTCLYYSVSWASTLKLPFFVEGTQEEVPLAITGGDAAMQENALKVALPAVSPSLSLDQPLIIESDAVEGDGSTFNALIDRIRLWLWG